ncbi:hypothetical protein [Spiroplasma melliferum]|uniref:hypothetical protein n=2 Tax=Spiroplasma melliferum TaxID=2134 RepID=UPI000C788CEB|nr:hypothetical protein [Spiroplasma melliferum]
MAKVGGKSSIALPTVFQVGGNTATEKAIGDIAVLQIKRILEADSEYIDATEMMMLTAQQVTMAEGWEQGQYVFPERMVWGTDYDMNSGMEQQSVAVRRATVMMDQMLTFKYDVPTFDVVRFMESPVLMFGTKKDDLMVHVAMPSFAQFTKAYTKILDQIGADTLATGQLWKKMIVGVDVFESWYLGRQFNKGKDTGINKDMDFNLNYSSSVGAWGFIGHKEDCAMPQGWKSIQQVINQNTGNVRYLGRGLYSLPTFMRQLHWLFVSGDVSNTDITNAQKNRGVSYELAPWIDLQSPTLPNINTVITTSNLGTFTFTGASPTQQELEAQVKIKNSKYNNGDATFANITATGAKANGTTGKFTGSIDLTYTKG